MKTTKRILSIYVVFALALTMLACINTSVDAVESLEDEVLFSENFENYSTMSNPSTSITKTYDTSKWSAYSNNWRRGSYITDLGGNKVMRSLVGWVDGVGSTYASPILAETNWDANDTSKNFKTGKIEVNFDLAMFTDTTGEYEHEFQFLLDNGYDDPNNESDHVQQPLFSIRNNQIKGYERIEYSTYNIIEGFTISDDDITKFNTFKVLIDIDASKAELFIKQNAKFVKIHEAEFSTKLKTHGLKTVRFMHLKAGGDPTDNMSGSAIDNISIIKKVLSPYEDNTYFDDGFESYNLNSDPEVKGEENNAALQNPKKWSIPPAVSWHYGAIIAAGNGGKILRLRPKQETRAKSLSASALLGSTFYDGITEIYFEAVLQNPIENDAIMQEVGSDIKSDNFVEILLGKDGVSNNYPVMRINRTDIDMYSDGVYARDTISEYTNSNDITKFNKYKLVVDMDERAISIYIYDSTEYKLVKSTSIRESTLGTNGFDKIIFSHYKTKSSGALDENTFSAFDNIKVIKRAIEFKDTVEDNFSKYTSVSNAGKEDTFSTVDNPIWTNKISRNWWGYGAYIFKQNENNVLRFDVWQNSAKASARIDTLLNRGNINSGTIEVIFDAAVQNPVSNIENGYTNYFTFGLTGNEGTEIFPVFDIDTNDIKIYGNISSNETISKKVDSYLNKNDLEQLNRYKVVIDFEARKIKVYVYNGSEYILLGKSTISFDLKTNGMENLFFRHYKDDSNEKALAENTSTIIDNVKIEFKEGPSEDIVTKEIEVDSSAQNICLECDLLYTKDAESIYVGFENSTDSTSVKSNIFELHPFANILVMGKAETAINITEGIYHLKADINYALANMTITITTPDGTVIQRSDPSYFNGTSNISKITVSSLNDVLSDVSLTYPEVVLMKTDTSAYDNRFSEIANSAGITQTDGFKEKAYNLVTTFVGDASTTRGFAWTASAECDDMVIKYAEKGNWKNHITVDAIAEEYDGKLYYKAELSELNGATEYIYQIGDRTDNVWSSAYAFITEDKDDNSFSFIGVADPQASTQESFVSYTQTLDAAVSDAYNAEFILNLGDMVNTGNSENQWKYFFEASEGYSEYLPQMAVIGNHESRAKDSDDETDVEAGKNYRLHFNNPDNGGKKALGNLTVQDMTYNHGKGLVTNIDESVYSFDYGDAHFVVLNSGSDWGITDSLKLLEAQAEWMRKDLEATDKKWKIVAVHQGQYPAKTEREFGSIKVLEKVFEECNVDLVLNGHDHMVARTYQNNKTDISELSKGEGVVFNILGSAGSKRYDTLTKTPEYLAVINTSAYTLPTYTLFNVTEDCITVTSKQINGLVIDEYTITDSIRFNYLTCEDGKIKVKIDLTNELENQNGKIMIALYNKNNVLINLLSDVAEDELNEFNIESGEYTVKAYYIDDISSILPLCRTIHTNVVCY